MPDGFPALGPRKEVQLRAGTIGYHDVGSGPPLVFVHGLLANGALWSLLVPLLSDRFRCVVPDWPLGSHSPALGTALTPYSVADMIGELCDTLELDQPTLVGNDTGGALCQMAVVRRPELASRLVLTNCDAYDQFPPQPFKYLTVVPRIPGSVAMLAATMRLRPVRRLPIAYGWLAKRMPPEVEESFVRPAIRDSGVRADVTGLLRAIDKRQLVETATRYSEIRIPVTLAWADEDRAFKVELAERMSGDIPNAELIRIPDSYTFVALDQPERLAAVF